MEIALAIFGIAFAAFSVWLAARIINRRERWAKWTAGAVIGLPVLYVLSFGPACKILPVGQVVSVFCPILIAAADGPPLLKEGIIAYAEICGGGNTAYTALFLTIHVR